MIWNLIGTDQQKALVQSAVDACTFPFDQLAPSLAREGKTSINVEWADLSRRAAESPDHEHDHDHDEGAHTIVREVEGRARVLGLFYLPPYTRVVLDSSLVNHPDLAREVFLAEGAHAVDYHYMVERGLRRAVWNALHADHEDASAEILESGDVGHGHSWFDGPGGYATWVGESWMALFIKAFAPTVPVTINLAHPISDAAVTEVREAFFPSTTRPYATAHGKTYHDVHKGMPMVRLFDGPAEAQAAGLRPCRVCKPA